jgi:hypothetical protein
MKTMEMGWKNVALAPVPRQPRRSLQDLVAPGNILNDIFVLQGWKALLD